ncbi:MAG: DUF1579 domain-containing protein [Acidobacteria bacterium]|nr:MAG: DUF1579 domain-containing protein [Acidobacteriota bacterium]REJ99339.1 MAG: DUF1579 domain-containing protein [Acidobacteriota bacterium]REK15639.1 MAG: DUF1579 domain-containing protein [Acidobacteriota bacterium]REK43622.1 MAG: DUF1579 domain-containing protein [Acidobacteriota bacterium]
MKNLRFTRAAIVAASFVIFLSGPVRAQDAGCQTERSKMLGFLSGTWTVQSDFRMSRNPEVWESTEGTSVIEPVFPGCLWKETLSGTREGKPITVAGLFGYSNISDKFQHTWAHSNHGVLTFYEGVFEEESLVFSAELIVGERKILFRKVIQRTAEGFDARTERSVDGGESWDTGWKVSYRRAKAGK